MNPSKPTGARAPLQAPALAAEGEIAALQPRCKPNTVRSRRARADRKAGIFGYARAPITRAFIGFLISDGHLAHEDRANRAAVVKAAEKYLRLLTAP
jgi:hypothetical protein